MLKLSRNSWHAKVFLWWDARKGYKYNTYSYSSSTKINLCPYVRAVLVWAPLRYLFLTGKKAWVSWIALFSVLEYLGWCMWKHKFLLVEWSFIVAFVIGLVWLTETGKQNDTLQSFGSVLQARWRGVHDRICPLAELVQPSQGDGLVGE